VTPVACTQLPVASTQLPVNPYLRFLKNSCRISADFPASTPPLTSIR